MYRAMYVYSIGFHQCVTDIVKESAVARPELVGRIWRTYSRLLELSERDNSDDGVAALERSHLDEMGRLKAQLAQAEASWAAQLVASRAEVKDSHEQMARRKQEVTELERRLSESAEELALARLTTEQEISRHADTAKELDASRARLAQLSTQLKEANLERSKLDASLVEAREGIAAAEKRANDANMQRQRACQRAEDARSDADKLQASLVATTAHVRDLKDQLQAKGDEIETLLAKVEELNAEVLARQSSETTRVKQLRELRFERSRLQRLLAEENKKSQDIRTELETEIVEHARAHRELTRVTEEYSHVEKQFQTVSKEHASLQERNNAVGSKLGATQALNKEYKEEMDRANARVASIGAELDVMSSKFEAETKQRLVVEEALRKRTMELATSVDALAKAKRTLSDRADAAQDARKRIVALESKMTVERASAQERIRRAADEAASLRSQVSELQAEARELRSESGSQLEAAKESAEARIQVARDEMAQLRRSLEACRQKELLLSTEVGAIAQNLSVNFACAADATAVREASVDAKSVLANEVERLERSEQDLQNLVSSTREDLQSVQAFAREISQERDEAQKNLSAAEQHIGSLKSRLAEAQAMIKELEKDRESVAKHSDELLESMTAEIEHVSVLKSANVALEAELQRLVSMRPNDAKLRTADASTQVDSDAFSSSAATSEGVEAGAE
ncbi:Laminin subunit alpha-2 [Hondaea fermentalgiana]|uniref:Laminin subunit alpha-2 n=1 Tax=Hondaea fermentalgiana TaxID=2315210 RepID=A0A2R5GA45_9STRA|nr:Laminin subunit alpha-2 [Hondaea fermentalgiana]|eukprot:GBG27179.1 Laminin subunit alpha-2 [Hondaea fermentalgiana]